MDLEKYRSQMAQRYPNTAFVEETLDNLKNNRAKSRIPFKKIGKAVGAASLLTAAAFAVLVGVGVMHGTLLEDSITEQIPEEERANLADREALMTPLSNPNHAVRISTENGSFAMNENTPAEEIVEHGGVIDSPFGFVGYERICNFFRAYRSGEAAELVIAELPTESDSDRSEYPFIADNGDELAVVRHFRRAYQYIGLNKDGTVKGKYYLHTGELLSTFPFERAGQTTSYGVKFGYCAATTSPDEQGDSCSTVSGMAIDLSSYGRGTYYGSTGDFISICTISDLLKVSERDGDTLREEYFDVLSNLGEKQGVNILWNGQYSSPSQLLTFLDRVQKGELPYCSTTITDLTKDGETEECFYALEYLDGKYRIFTMKNGFEGEFHTAFFDGYTVEEGMIVFENGSDEYRFPYPYEGSVYTYPSESNTAGVCTYSGNLAGRSNWVVRDGGGTSSVWRSATFNNNGGFTLYEGNTRFELLFFDPRLIAEILADPRNCVKISEEYSEGELLAIEILDKDEVPAYDGTTIIDVRAAPPEKTEKVEISGATLLFLEEDCDIREMPDGKSYVMITGTQWRGMTMNASTQDPNSQRLSLFVYYYTK